MGFDGSMCSAECYSSLYSLSILSVYHLAFWLNIFSHTSVGFDGIYVIASAFTFANYIIAGTGYSQIWGCHLHCREAWLCHLLPASVPEVIVAQTWDQQVQTGSRHVMTKL